MSNIKVFVTCVVVSLTTSIVAYLCLFTYFKDKILVDFHPEHTYKQEITSDNSDVSSFRINKIEHDIRVLQAGKSCVGLYSKDYLIQTLYKEEIEDLQAKRDAIEREVRNRSLSLQAEEENLMMNKKTMSQSDVNIQQQRINKKRLEIDNYGKLQERSLNTSYDALERKFGERLEYAANLVYKQNPDMVAMISINSGISFTPQISESKLITFTDINSQLLSTM